MQREATADPWVLGEPEPTTLIALWSGDEAPTRDDVAAAITSFAGAEAKVFGDAAPGADDVLWNAVVALPGRDRPAIFWSEPARPLDPRELDDPAALGCRWILGVETLLDEAGALQDFSTMMRLVAGAFPRVTAVLDVNSGRWHPRRSLDEHFVPGAAPPESVLWTTHVAMSSPDDADALAWLHTHGLPRCGRPDLEMIDVPVRLAQPAAELLSALAGRVVEEGAASPGELFEAGPELVVCLHPWQSVAPRIGDAPGGTADRIGMPGEAHVGVRAVVCSVENDRDETVMPWPQDVLERIGGGAGSFYLSRHETRRLSEQARAAWPRFVDTFRGMSPSLLSVESWSPGEEEGAAARFLVKAGIGVDGPHAPSDAEREHLWFIVRQCEAERFKGELLNEPAVVRSLHRGDVIWVERRYVSGWSVVMPQGSYGPKDAAALAGALDALAAMTGGEP